MAEKIPLTKEFLKGELTVFDSIKTRRTVREYSGEPITIEEFSTLLFATQGITSEDLKRTAPSAGASYPLETYIIVNNVSGLEKGLYHYIPEEHSVEAKKLGDFSREIKKGGRAAESLPNAAVVFIWAAVFERAKNEEKRERYISIEAGHTSQNLYLQANSLGLGVVAIGSFNDEEINQFLGLDGEKESVIYMNAVGRKNDKQLRTRKNIH